MFTVSGVALAEDVEVDGRTWGISGVEEVSVDSDGGATGSPLGGLF
jgi:hypothetical protein